MGQTSSETQKVAVYTFDTNALIYYLKDDPDVVLFMDDVLSHSGLVAVSTITELELFSFKPLSITEASAIEQLLATVSVFPLDSRIARIAGSLRREFNISVPDAAIAATALFTGSTLLTRNVRDFRKVPHLVVQAI